VAQGPDIGGYLDLKFLDGIYGSWLSLGSSY